MQIHDEQHGTAFEVIENIPVALGTRCYYVQMRSEAEHLKANTQEAVIVVETTKDEALGMSVCIRSNLQLSNSTIHTTEVRIEDARALTRAKSTTVEGLKQRRDVLQFRLAAGSVAPVPLQFVSSFAHRHLVPDVAAPLIAAAKERGKVSIRQVGEQRWSNALPLSDVHVGKPVERKTAHSVFRHGTRQKRKGAAEKRVLLVHDRIDDQPASLVTQPFAAGAPGVDCVLRFHTQLELKNTLPCFVEYQVVELDELQAGAFAKGALGRTAGLFEHVTPVNGRTGVIGAGRSAQVLGLETWPKADPRTGRCTTCGKRMGACVACGPRLLLRLRLLPIDRRDDDDDDAGAYDRNANAVVPEWADPVPLHLTHAKKGGKGGDFAVDDGNDDGGSNLKDDESRYLVLQMAMSNAYPIPPQVKIDRTFESRTGSFSVAFFVDFWIQNKSGLAFDYRRREEGKGAQYSELGSDAEWASYFNGDGRVPLMFCSRQNVKVAKMQLSVLPRGFIDAALDERRARQRSRSLHRGTTIGDGGVSSFRSAKWNEALGEHQVPTKVPFDVFTEDTTGKYCPSIFICRTLFQIERTAWHSYGPDPHSC